MPIHSQCLQRAQVFKQIRRQVGNATVGEISEYAAQTDMRRVREDEHFENAEVSVRDRVASCCRRNVGQSRA